MKGGSSLGGWIVAVIALAGFNGLQYSEKASLQGKVEELERSNRIAAAELVAAKAAKPTPSVEIESLTPEQKDNLEAEKSFGGSETLDPSAPSVPDPRAEWDRLRDLENKGGPDQPATAGDFVGSAKSDKFHNPFCSSANRIKAENLVYYASRAEAVSAGKEPCRVCSP